MKKVLYIHHGDLNGGAPRSLRFLIEKLDKDEYEPIVVYRCNENDGVFFEDCGARTIFEKSIRPFHGSTVTGIDFKQIIYNFVYAIPTYFAMKRIVKQEQPNIVHLNSTCLFMCAAAAKSVNKNIKTICHIREPLLPNIWGTILRVMSNKYCDSFIAIDEFDGSTVDPNGIKTTVIYNFVDFNTYNSSVQSTVLFDELHLDKNSVVFLVLARLSPENGIYEIISQWRRLNIPETAHLVVVGEIENREIDYSNKCHKIADSSTNIHILPFRKDVADVLASSDVIICSFTQPHFARALIEGAAMGKPSISIDIDGPKELVIDGKTGLLYKNTQELQQCVNLLISNESLRESMGKEAESLAKNKFNADINAMATFEMYN